MKTNLSASLRSIRLSILALASTAFVGAAETTPDHAAQKLARTGSVAVTSVGRYVEIGTFRMQVAAKLGQPDLRLADGTWLYHHRSIGDSSAAGTVVVRFAAGRVSSLSLVTPAVVATLLRAPNSSETARIASNR